MVAFVSNNPDTMNYLFNFAKRLIELEELYKELCMEFCVKKGETNIKTL